MTPTHLLKQALTWTREGAYTQALPLLRQAITAAVKPSAETLEALGICLQETGAWTEAETVWRQYCQTWPANPLPQVFLAQSLAAQGQHHAALATYQQALQATSATEAEQAPLRRQIQVAIAHQYLQIGELKAAEKHVQALLTQNPNDEELRLQVLILQEHDLQAWELCLQGYRAFVRDFPHSRRRSLAHCRMAQVLCRLQLYPDALTELKRILEQAPGYPPALQTLSQVMLEVQQPSLARSCVLPILQSLRPPFPIPSPPQDPPTVQALGGKRGNKYLEFLKHVNLAQPAPDLDPAQVKLWLHPPVAHSRIVLKALSTWIRSLFQERRWSEALALMELLNQQGLSNPGLVRDQAEVYLQLGRFSQAQTLLEHTLAHPNLTQIQRRNLLYQQTRVQDRAHKSAEAFASARQAHALETDRFDPAQHRHLVDVITQTFTAPALARWRSNTAFKPSDEINPLFIVGMPRSGSTLVEQILSSHPAVGAAGEAPFVLQTAQALLGADFPPSRQRSVQDLSKCWDTHLSGAAYASLAELLRQKWRQRVPEPEKTWATDKMLANFLWLGLIELLFPQARIIHCLRHPLDTCLSCYLNSFRQLSFNHKLEDLGFYYQQYQRLMRHWQVHLSLPVLDLAYEDLVQAPETQMRKLLAFCGLEWDPRCLSFYRNPHQASTLSAWQVQEPIYTHALNRHQAYAQELAPLRAWIELPQ